MNAPRKRFDWMDLVLGVGAGFVLGIVLGCAPSQDVQRDAQTASAPVAKLVMPANNMGIYASVRGDGTPLVNADGTPNREVIAQFGQHGWRIMPGQPFNDSRGDLFEMIDSVSVPNAKNVLYTTSGFSFGPKEDRRTHYGRWGGVLRRNDALFDSTEGGFHVRLHRPAVVDSLADFWISEVRMKRPNGKDRWDGWFGDGLCDFPPGDYRGEGFASQADFVTAWRAGRERLIRRLRAGLPGKLLMGNCNRPPTSQWFGLDGHMLEAFPGQNGGLAQLLDWANPDSAAGPLVVFTDIRYAVGSPAEAQRIKYGAACAMLATTMSRGPAIHVHAPSDPNPQPGDSMLVGGKRMKVRWWEKKPDPELYAPMGRPFTNAYRDGSLWRRDFEKGSVLVDDMRQVGYFVRCQEGK